MLNLVVPGGEYYDEASNKFISYDDTALQLEHSLLSISKWESKTHKAFLAKNEKTNAEILDYIECMTINPVADRSVYTRLTPKNVQDVIDYIQDPMSATKLKKLPNEKTSKDVLTSELLYYYMVAAQIPFECQKWHLNRLLTLIEIYSRKNNPKKKSQADLVKEYKSINEANRARFNSKG